MQDAHYRLGVPNMEAGRPSSVIIHCWKIQQSGHFNRTIFLTTIDNSRFSSLIQENWFPAPTGRAVQGHDMDPYQPENFV